MNVTALVNIIQANKCKVRLKVKGSPVPESWSNGAIIPTPGYVEINGPWPVHQVEWVEINPAVTERVGRLLPPRQVNSLAQIEVGLNQASLLYSIFDGIIRVPFLDTTV